MRCGWFLTARKTMHGTERRLHRSHTKWAIQPTRCLKVKTTEVSYDNVLAENYQWGLQSRAHSTWRTPSRSFKAVNFAILPAVRASLRL